MKNDDKTGRQQWQKPELVVLTRNNPEENVLLACKVTGRILTSGPSKGSYQCTTQAACYAAGSS
jgi:hypothetical protein